MPSLLIGPLLRHVDQVSATVWVETDSACTVRVRTPGSAESLAEARTFHVGGHHYALVIIEGLTAGSTTPYEVLLDSDVVWPDPDTPYPPSRIRTPGRNGPFVVAFGSCRYATPLAVATDPDEEFPPDALDTYASVVAEQPEQLWPDALVLLGDQVYADEIAEPTREYLEKRRDLRIAPGEQLANFEEFTFIYHQSWSDPDIRWLLSTIPSSMIFDDHDVIDDWNTSQAWREGTCGQPWWDDRIAGALGSYWIYQHIGNLAPDDLRADPHWQTVTAAEDGADLIRELALAADRDPHSIRWSYHRHWHKTRLIMIDSRAGRVLDEDRRSMLDDDEFRWLEDQLARAGADGVEHVLLGTSLPMMMPPALHDLEAANSALVTKYRDRRLGRLAEKVRQGADLEHWAAFRDSFDRLGAAIELLARGSHGHAPASVLVLSGDVHHAYVAEVVEPAGLTSRVYQLTCSPVHNEVPHPMVQTFKLGWNKAAIALTAGLRRIAGVPPTRLRWVKRSGPFFGNELAVLTLDSAHARIQLEAPEHVAGQPPRMRRQLDSELC